MWIINNGPSTTTECVKSLRFKCTITTRGGAEKSRLENAGLLYSVSFWSVVCESCIFESPHTSPPPGVCLCVRAASDSGKDDVSDSVAAGTTTRSSSYGASRLRRFLRQSAWSLLGRRRLLDPSTTVTYSTSWMTSRRSLPSTSAKVQRRYRRQ